jgi:lipid-A-disaccharide synthase
MEKQKKIIIVAGEASGDIHAANLVRAIHAINQDILFFGLGGTKMKEAGVKLFYNLADLAVIGLVEVLKNFAKFRRIFIDFLNKIDDIKPEAAILVDYPGFNLRLAKELKKRNIKVIYYISPQVWAWGTKRIQKIKSCVDKMIVILKFEEQLYYNAGIDVSFVGHPLLDIVKPDQKRQDFLRENNLTDDNLTICLLPGSREKEIQRLLPIMLKSSEMIHKHLPSTQFILVKSHTLKQEIFDKYTKNYKLPITIIEDNTYNCLNSCDFALVASGTATLEAAIMKTPMIILYKLSLFSWLLLKNMVRIPHIGLVNVVAGKKIVPELIQYNCTPQKITSDALKILTNQKIRQQINSDLEELKNLLGLPGASSRAAKIVLESI